MHEIRRAAAAGLRSRCSRRCCGSIGRAAASCIFPPPCLPAVRLAERNAGSERESGMRPCVVCWCVRRATAVKVNRQQRAAATADDRTTAAKRKNTTDDARLFMNAAALVLDPEYALIEPPASKLAGRASGAAVAAGLGLLCPGWLRAFRPPSNQPTIRRPNFLGRWRACTRARHSDTINHTDPTTPTTPQTRRQPGSQGSQRRCRRSPPSPRGRQPRPRPPSRLQEKQQPRSPCESWSACGPSPSETLPLHRQHRRTGMTTTATATATRGSAGGSSGGSSASLPRAKAACRSCRPTRTI